LNRERNQLLSKNKLSLTHLVREPGRKESSSAPPLLLLLHGIGSNEADLFGLAPYLDTRFLVVSARAPLVMGPGSFGWFNIELTSQGMVADIEQAKESLQILPKFIDELIETYHLDAGCVYLMGFSQGAMMTLAHAINHPAKIGGAIVMSGRYPTRVLEGEPDKRALDSKPFLVTHGIYDPVLPIEEGRLVRENLEALPVKLTYREYPMGHEVSMESLRDVSAWLTSSLDESLTKLP
jgi:phospholipase/carboxylesterase